MPNVESPCRLVQLFPERISFPRVPELGPDVHWIFALYIRCDVNCRKTTSGVWSGCAYRTLDVGQPTHCLCGLVTPPQTIKRMTFALHHCTRVALVLTLQAPTALWMDVI